MKVSHRIFLLLTTLLSLAAAASTVTTDDGEEIPVSDAVSYTHLDVYKRQALDNASNIALLALYSNTSWTFVPSGS